MITIPVHITQGADGSEFIGPAAPIPADAIKVVCDGTQYIVYQPGDVLPEAPPAT
jgi:hypothetical protein